MTTRAESAGAGLRSILVATAIAGALGYVIQLLAPRLLADDMAYVTFSVYWSSLYLFVAALSGVQQEVTRAARPAADEPPSRVLVNFTFIAAAAVVLLVAAFALVLGSALLPGRTVVLAGCLVLGVVGYLTVAVLSGVLYGLRLWAAVAWITALDAALRTVLVVSGLVFGWPAEALAVAISLPFGLAFLVVWLRVRSRVVGKFRLDVSLRRLLAQAGGTVVAAAAMGLIMNGMPMLLGVVASGSDAAVLAGLILAITVTRAPIVVPLLALQSYLISIMRGGGSRMRRRVLRVLTGAAAAVLVLAALAALLGPWVIEFVSGGRSSVSAPMMAAITAGAGMVAMMCVTGPALIAERRHVPYVSGWVVAALLTLACLQIPGALEAKVTLAMLAPPAAGIAVHLVAIWRTGDDGSAPRGSLA
jgi:hypothetical protein